MDLLLLFWLFLWILVFILLLLFLPLCSFGKVLKEIILAIGSSAKQIWGITFHLVLSYCRNLNFIWIFPLSFTINVLLLLQLYLDRLWFCDIAWIRLSLLFRILLIFWSGLEELAGLIWKTRASWVLMRLRIGILVAVFVISGTFEGFDGRGWWFFWIFRGLWCFSELKMSRTHLSFPEVVGLLEGPGLAQKGVGGV